MPDITSITSSDEKKFTVEVIEEPRFTVIVNDEAPLAVEVVEQPASSVSVFLPGIQGVAGPTGPTGPVGPTGDPGIVVSPTPPANTSKIWVDNS